MAGPLQPGVGLQQTFLEPFQPADVPAVVVVAGTAPLPVIQGRRWPIPTRSASDWSSGNKTAVIRGNSQWIQPPAAPGGNAPVITVARRRPAPRRSGSDWNNSASTLLQVSASGAQWIQAPVYNSGGRSPGLTRAPQRSSLPPSRALADANGGVGPVSALRGGAQWVQVQATAAAVAVTPTVVRAPRRISTTRSRPRSRLVFRSARSATPPRLVQGVVRQAVRRRSRSRLQTTGVYNSSGLTPALIKGLKRRNLTRAQSRRVAQPAPVVVVGATPVVVAAVQKRQPTRSSSRRFSPPYTGGGIEPGLTQGIRRLAAKVELSHLVVPPTTFVAAAGTAPLQTRGVFRRPLPSLRSRLIVRPVVAAPGIAPQISVARRRGPAKRSLSRLVAPAPTGVQLAPIAPLVLSVHRQLPPRRPGSRLQVAPRFNSGGLAPELLAALRRPPAKVKPSRWLPAPSYNSGGIAPARSQGVRRINRHRPGSRLKVQAAYNSGGIRPAFRVVPRQKPPTRGRSLLPKTGVIPQGLTGLRYYVDSREASLTAVSAEATASWTSLETQNPLSSAETQTSWPSTEPGSSDDTEVLGQ